MPLSVNWYDDEYSIIIVTLTYDTTWNQYHDAVDWLVSEADKVDHRVDIIFHDNVGMPKGNPMPHLSRGSTKILDQRNIHFTIIAGTQGHSGFTRMMLGALAKTFARLPLKPLRSAGELLFMDTLEEALERIKQDRVHSSIE